MNQLALGTAQFGLRYGIANTTGQVAPATIAAIMDCARRGGIDTLDTAIAYGESESRLGEAGVSSWRVISKLPALPRAVPDIRAWVQQQVHGSLQRLGITQLDGLLLHRAADLLGPAAGADYIRALEELKASGSVRSVGISIYAPEDLVALWQTWRPDIVQAPCNVFDRRLIHSGWLGRLADAGVRVHVRSVFLQGLLLMPAAARPASFDTWSRLLNRWSDWCSTEKITPLAGALSFVLAQPWIERVVIGVESVAQLREILQAASAGAPVPAAEIYTEDRDLIDPSRWKLT